jgi:hypothetical protein
MAPKGIFSAWGASIPAAAWLAASAKSRVRTVTVAPSKRNSRAIAKPITPPPRIKLSAAAAISWNYQPPGMAGLGLGGNGVVAVPSPFGVFRLVETPPLLLDTAPVVPRLKPVLRVGGTVLLIGLKKLLCNNDGFAAFSPIKTANKMRTAITSRVINGSPEFFFALIAAQFWIDG